MGFFNFLGRQKAATSKPQAQEPQTTGYEIGRWRNAPTRRDTYRLLDAYGTMPILGTVVDVVAEAVSDVEWTATLNGKSDPNHPILQLLANPNEFISGRDL